MGSIDKYIFRTTLASFALVLVSLTGVIWITQALRGIDLMTSQGQTIITFLGITSLVIPALVLIIAPIALMIAVSHTLNKLATDSEIIVMNAAGFSPFRLFRPFFFATCVVALMVAFIGAYLAPDGMRRIKQWDAEITADVLTNILQPGRFAQLDQNLTIRIRDRLPGGVLGGIFVDDRRDPKERVTIIADHGTVLKTDSGSYLILEDGNLERFEVGKRDPALVAFGRYAFDMSKFSNQRDAVLGIRERYIWELVSPDENDPVFKAVGRTVPCRIARPLHGAGVSVRVCDPDLRIPRLATHHAPKPQLLDRRFDHRRVRPAHDRIRLLGDGGEEPCRSAGPVFDAVRLDRDRLVDDHRRRRGRTAGLTDRSDQPIERAPRAALWTAGRSMSMMTNTLGRYFAGRFLVAAVGVFASIFVLLVLVDYIEMVRKTSGLVSVSAITVAQTSLYRVPQLLEKLMPFCVLIGAMTCYLALSRRLELVVARAAGVSAWPVHCASTRQRNHPRHHGDHRLQSDVG